MISRFSAKNIIPVEIWNGLVNGVSLYGADKKLFPYVLRDFLISLFHGKAAVSDELPGKNNLETAIGFTEVILCGGRAEDPVIWDCLKTQRLPFMVSRMENPQFSGIKGGECLSEELNYKNPLIIDWGQSYIKTNLGKKFLIERNKNDFPLNCGNADSSRKRISELFNELIRCYNNADGVILGLPVEIDSECIAEGCTYSGMKGDLKVVFKNEKGLPVTILNDTELSSYSIHVDEKKLVVSLGTGVGGAVCLGK